MNCPFCNKKTSDESKYCVHCGKDVRNLVDMNCKRVLRCPICHSTSEVIQISNVELDLCRKCSGIWLDKSEFNNFKKIIENDDLANVLKNLINGIPANKTRNKRGAYISCPICKGLMSQSNFEDISGIILDKCLSHGIWLERQDLEQILDLINRIGFEELSERASIKRSKELDNKLSALERNQSILKHDLGITRVRHNTHLLLDIFGIL